MITRWLYDNDVKYYVGRKNGTKVCNIVCEVGLIKAIWTVDKVWCTNSIHVSMVVDGKVYSDSVKHVRDKDVIHNTAHLANNVIRMANEETEKAK